MGVVAIVLAAGQGKRMNSCTNKQYLLLEGKPILAHTLQTFEDLNLISEVIVVARTDELDFCTHEIVEKYDFKKVSKIVKGGKERQDSVYQGLVAVSVAGGLVLVHDGARPLVTPELVIAAVDKARTGVSAVCAVPMKDTVKEVTLDCMVTKTLSRAALWAVQTPQVFSYAKLVKAHEEARLDNYLGTDDASLLERIGEKVAIVLGLYENIKITTPIDLVLAEAILKGRRGS